MEVETPIDPPVIDIKDSILNSVKKQLGILPELKDFDPDIIMNINAAIATLRQLGVGPQSYLYFVEDETQTYDDYLGEDCPDVSYVKMYLTYKVKLSFDPPQSSIVMESIKALIKEMEWRLNIQADPPDTFRRGGVIS